jgi:hypothetical protein
VEYLLELLRAKGYFVLYPAFPSNPSSSLVTIHNELYKTPEEFSSHSAESPSSLAMPSDNLPEDPFTTHLIDNKQAADHPEAILSHNPSILHLLSSPPIYPDAEHNPLPGREALPILLHTGEKVASEYADFLSQSFANDFSVEVGNCKEPNHERLFCLEDEEEVAEDGPGSKEETAIGSGDKAAAPQGKPLVGAKGAIPTSTTTSLLPTGFLEVTPNAILPD